MSTGPAAIVDPWILQNSHVENSDGWDPDFPADNILDPSPKVKARASLVDPPVLQFTIDTENLSPIPGSPLRFNVFSLLFVEGLAPGATTARVRASDSGTGPWTHDTGIRTMWPGVLIDAAFKNPENYNPPGVHVHLYLGASIWDTETRFVRFDFATQITPSFRIGGAACAEALIMPAEFGSSAGTPIEESQDLWTWGDERIVRPGPKYDRKDWSLFLTKAQKEESAYMTLKRRGSSAPIIAVDELPAPLPAANDQPWERHQGTLYGTITGISPLIRAAPNLFRSRIDFQEL